MEKYTVYNIEEFVLDSLFIAWVKTPDADLNAMWKAFIVNHPEKEITINEARNILLSLNFNESLSYLEKETLWDNIEKKTYYENTAKVVPLNATKHVGYFKQRYAVAAAVLLFFIAGGLYFHYAPSFAFQKEVTRYGEIRKVALPDGSVVTLNAHSQIKFKVSWDTKNIREVWLDGEAFFSVLHKKNNQPFIVHSQEMDIEVLGTEFNVFKREGKAKVSLNSGSIKLSLRDAPQLTPVYLKPGELIELQPGLKTFVKKIANPANYSAWKEHKMILDDTPVLDIINMMKDNYGWEIIVKDTALLSEKLTGEIQIGDELKCLNALSRVLDLNITKTGNNITVDRN